MNQIPVLITPPRRPVVEQSPQSTTSLSDSQQCCGVVSKRKLFFMICTIIVIFILLNSWTGVLERKFDYMSLPVWIFLSKGIWSIVAAVTEPKIAYRHELCMLTRVKNAAYLFPQWIEFHILAGIDHFWIADDCSDDDGKTMFWLKFYADLGFVSIYKSPHVDCANHIPREWDLYNALFDRVQPKCKWTAVFDVDEYIFPTNEDEGKTAQGPYLKTLVKEARKPIFRMPSRFMSTHAREKRPPGLIIDAYVHDEFNPVIKTIIMSKYVALWNFSHYPHKLRREVPRIEGKVSAFPTNKPQVTQGYSFVLLLLLRLCWKDFEELHVQFIRTEGGVFPPPRHWQRLPPVERYAMMRPGLPSCNATRHCMRGPQT